MDKLFDGSDAHLLHGNAALIERLRHNPAIELFAEAADALEAADKRIAKLEAELQKRAKQIGVACMTHDLTHSLACGRCLTEAERKLAVAQEALDVATTYSMLEIDRKIIVEALTQIGGDDASQG